MKTVVAVVAGQSVSDAAQCEPAVGDSVGKAADDSAKVRVICFIAGERVIAEHNIGRLPRAVGNLEGDDSAAVIGDGGLQTVLIGQGIELRLPPIAGCAERFAGHSGILGDGARCLVRAIISAITLSAIRKREMLTHYWV